MQVIGNHLLLAGPSPFRKTLSTEKICTCQGSAGTILQIHLRLNVASFCRYLVFRILDMFPELRNFMKL